MDFEHYKNFVCIVEAGTISAASKKLLVAQPALSKQLKSFEEEYGAQLMIRGSRHVELTDAGKVLYDKIKRICYLEDAARKEITDCVSGNRGILWFGTTPAYPEPMLEKLLLDFHREYPQVSFEIFEQNSDQIIQLLNEGIIEVGLVRTNIRTAPQLRRVLTIREHLMAYYHREHPAFSSEMSEIPITGLREWPLSIAKGFREQFAQACVNSGFEPNLLNVSASRAMSQLWAGDGRTVAVLVAPEAFDDGDFCCRPIRGDDMETRRSFAVEKERELSGVASTFLGFCRQHPMVRAWVIDEPSETRQIEQGVRKANGNIPAGCI